MLCEVLVKALYLSGPSLYKGTVIVPTLPSSKEIVKEEVIFKSRGEGLLVPVTTADCSRPSGSDACLKFTSVLVVRLSLALDKGGLAYHLLP